MSDCAIFIYLNYFYLKNILLNIVDLQCCVRSVVQRSVSVLQKRIAVLLQILFLWSLSQSTEEGSLCYMTGPRCPSIPCRVVCTCQFQTPKLPLPPPFPSGKSKFAFKGSESVSVSQIRSFVSFKNLKNLFLIRKMFYIKTKFLWLHLWHWKFPGRGLNPNCRCSNTR